MAPFLARIFSLGQRPTDAESVALESEVFIKKDFEDERGFNKKQPSRPLPWMLSTLALSITTLMLLVTNLSGYLSRRPLFHESDLQDARKAIHYEQRVWTGALKFDVDLERIVRLKDSPIEYVGPPTQDIDDAWETLLKNEFPVMTPSEAKPFLPDLIPWNSDQQYHFEPEVFHSLHCLNGIRMELSRSLYPNATHRSHEYIDPSLLTPGFKEQHMEHCIDRIRQAIMCSGDLTPSPMYTWPGHTRLALGRTMEHTCRKWEPIREWMDKRWEAGGDAEE